MVKTEKVWIKMAGICFPRPLSVLRTPYTLPGLRTSCSHLFWSRIFAFFLRSCSGRLWHSVSYSVRTCSQCTIQYGEVDLAWKFFHGPVWLLPGSSTIKQGRRILSVPLFAYRALQTRCDFVYDFLTTRLGTRVGKLS